MYNLNTSTPHEVDTHKFCFTHNITISWYHGQSYVTPREGAAASHLIHVESSRNPYDGLGHMGSRDPIPLHRLI